MKFKVKLIVPAPLIVIGFPKVGVPPLVSVKVLPRIGANNSVVVPAELLLYVKVEFPVNVIVLPLKVVDVPGLVSVKLLDCTQLVAIVTVRADPVVLLI
jgi:hypothetical protein